MSAAALTIGFRRDCSCQNSSKVVCPFVISIPDSKSSLQLCQFQLFCCKSWGFQVAMTTVDIMKPVNGQLRLIWPVIMQVKWDALFTDRWIEECALEALGVTKLVVFQCILYCQDVSKHINYHSWQWPVGLMGFLFNHFKQLVSHSAFLIPLRIAFSMSSSTHSSSGVTGEPLKCFRVDLLLQVV